MKIVKKFKASGAPETVFQLFQDIPAVAQCLPGAELTGGEGEGPYSGLVVVAVGPVSASFEGEATVRSDASTLSGQIEGRGRDPRGGNRGELTMRYWLEPDESGATMVSIDVDVELSGPIARFGRTGIMDEIADQLIGDFSSCLDAKLSARSPSEAASVTAPRIKGFRLIVSGVFRSLVSWLRRVLGRRGG